MSRKRIALCAFLVLVTKCVTGAVMFGLVFQDALAGSSPAFRVEGTEAHGVAMAGYIAWSFALSILFARTSNTIDWREGMRFGLLVWCFYFVPMTLGIHGYFVVEPTWTACALASGLAEALACGSVAAWVFRGVPPGSVVAPCGKHSSDPRARADPAW